MVVPPDVAVHHFVLQTGFMPAIHAPMSIHLPGGDNTGLQNTQRHGTKRGRCHVVCRLGCASAPIRSSRAVSSNSVSVTGMLVASTFNRIT